MDYFVTSSQSIRVSKRIRNIYRLIFFIVIASLLISYHQAAVGAQSNGQEIVTSFESYAAGWTGDLGQGASITQEDVYDGNAALLLDASDKSKEVQVYSRVISVKPGKPYRLQVYVKQLALGNYKATIEWLKDGQHVAYANDWKGRNNPKSYQSHGGEFKAPKNANQAKLILGASKGNKVLFDKLVFQPVKPQIRIFDSEAKKSVVKRGEEFDFALGIKNPVYKSINDIEIKLKSSDNLEIIKSPNEVNQLDNKEENYLNWTLRANTVGVASVEVKLDSNNTPSVSKKFLFGVSGFWPDISLPNSKEIDLRESDNHLVMRNSKIALVFHKDEGNFGPFGLFVNSPSGWELVGTSPVFSTIAYKDRADELRLEPVMADSFELLSKSRDDIKLRFQGNLIDHDGTQWSFEFTYGLKSEESSINTNFKVETSRKREVSYIQGPMLLAGSQSFGSKKDLALLPGVSYLLEGEETSGSFEHNIDSRIPHPYKVTVPAMEVTYNDSLVGLTWDPLQKWDEENRYPSIKFASPNNLLDWLPGDQNHLMSLFLPSIPKWYEENGSVYEASPYTLEADKEISLQARLFAEHYNDKRRPYTLWFEDNSLPKIPESPISYSEEIDLIVKSYAETLLQERSFGWAGTNGQDPIISPQMVNSLMTAARMTNDSDLRDQGYEVGEEAINRLKNKNRINLDIAYKHGNIIQTINRAKDRAQNLAASQDDHGGWSWYPDEEWQNLYGEPGETALGIVAKKAYRILKAASITGDPNLIRAGERALIYMERFERPEGGETWEVPLHDPNLHAASWAIKSYLKGYEITKEEKYLKEAVDWGIKSLPFIYAWEAHNRSIMKYSSISVIGASLFPDPVYYRNWRGTPVQWVGLVHADALLQLAKHDKTFPWKKIAKGLINVGIGFQKRTWQEFPDFKGRYTDYLDLPSDAICQSAHIDPNKIALGVTQLLGKNFEVTSKVLEWNGSKVFLSTRDTVQDTKTERTVLKMEIVGTKGSSNYVTVGKVEAPSKVLIDGKKADRIKSKSLFTTSSHSSNGAFYYSSEEKILFLKSSLDQEQIDISVYK